MRTLALSRLKQGFDSPRERHQIKGLVGVCDVRALAVDHPVDLAERNIYPQICRADLSLCRPAPCHPRHEARPRSHLSPTKFSVCHFGRRGRRALVEKTGIWRWIDGKQANRKSIGVWGFGLLSWVR